MWDGTAQNDATRHNVVGVEAAEGSPYRMWGSGVLRRDFVVNIGSEKGIFDQFKAQEQKAKTAFQKNIGKKGFFLYKNV